jgi:histidyl-tRNA synthetase
MRMPPDSALPKPGQSFRPKARRPRGLEDWRGAALARTREVIARVAKVYEDWGFEALETPALEYADALGKFLPDQDRPNEGVFSFQDDDEQWLALRYDLTAPLARYVAEHFETLPKPFRRWAAGPVWRNEKPGPGRYREFWQCDADTVGSASPAADAEMIAMACAALEAVGLARDAFALHVSDRRLLDAALERARVPAESVSVRLTVLRAIDKADRLGRDGVRALLGPGRRDESGDFTKGAGLAPEQIDMILGLVSATSAAHDEVFDKLDQTIGGVDIGKSALADLRAISATCAALGYDAPAIKFDPAIVRGLEYYTGPVFEAQLIGQAEGKRISFGSVGGGGRYDDLVARFRGERIPATGFSIGVSRLVAALQAAEAAPRVAEDLIVVLALEPDRMTDYFAMSSELRRAGLRAEVYLGAGRFGAQLKYADKRGARLAVIVGGDERAKGQVTIKDLQLGAALSKQIADNVAWRRDQPAQVEAPRAALVETARAMLSQPRG